MEQTEIIQVDTHSGNYVIIKQDLDGGFVGSTLILMVALTTCICVLIAVWRG